MSKDTQHTIMLTQQEALWIQTLLNPGTDRKIAFLKDYLSENVVREVQDKLMLNRLIWRKFQDITETDCPEEKLSDFLQPFKKVELNSKYFAELRPEGVTVGCQTFSYEAIEALAQACRERG